MAKRNRTKPRQPGEKSPAQKAADTMRKRRLDAAAKKKADSLNSPTSSSDSSKPAVEKSKVKVTPYPRTGENAAFEGVLDRVGLEAQKPGQKEPATEQNPAQGTEILTVGDVAEWIAWPFMLWAQQNELPALALTTKEAVSIAEPVTAILNRHAVGKVIPPDYLDALRAGGRLTPVVQDRFHKIKMERQRRAASGGDSHGPVATIKEQGGKIGVKVQQGATATKPREV